MGPGFESLRGHKRHSKRKSRGAFFGNYTHGTNQGLRIFFWGGGVPARAAPSGFYCNGRQASHFRFNPSRMLVGPHTRFAANIVLPRPNILPRRDFFHAPSIPGVTALVPRALTPGYRAFAPTGLLKEICILFLRRRDCINPKVASAPPQCNPFFLPKSNAI